MCVRKMYAAYGCLKVSNALASILRHTGFGSGILQYPDKAQNLERDRIPYPGIIESEEKCSKRSGTWKCGAKHRAT